MPLINQTFEYLPGIDSPVLDSELDSIKASLLSQIPENASSTLHPSLGEAYTPRFSDLITVEHERIASGAPRVAGIEVERYAALEAPTPATPETWKSTLQQAKASWTHLSMRNTTLKLLEEHGKNAWLISNAGLEVELGTMEKELAAAQAEAQAINQERQASIQEVQGEFEVLDETWRKGVGRALETEIAGEEMRRQILQARRSGRG